MKKLKQGQTVYTVYFDFNPRKYVLFSYFLYSQKEPLPPENCVIENMPVSLMNFIHENNPQDFITHSRRKAETRLKQMRLQYEK